MGEATKPKPTATKSALVRVAASGATQPPWLPPKKPARPWRPAVIPRAVSSAFAASAASSSKFCVYSPSDPPVPRRSEEHTSELQSLMRISYAVFCLKKKNYKQHDLTLAYERTRTE